MSNEKEKDCMKKIMILSNGCVPNLLEGKKILDLFIHSGWNQIEKPEDADIIVLNLCGYSGIQIDISTKIMYNLMKIKRPSTQMILTGCMEKINPDFKAKFPFHHVLDFSEFNKFLDVPAEMDKIYVSDQLVDILETTKKDTYNIVISKGCVGNCSYCAIRKARSPFRSKPIKEIINELHRGIDMGFKKIILWADDLGCYGLDSSTSYIDLLGYLITVQTAHDFKLFLHRLNPQWIIEYFDVFKTALSSDKIRLVYTPIQSGSTRILELMRRPYRIEDVINCLKDIKLHFPKVFLKTDIMVGFPSETDEDFQQTIDAIQEIKFDDIVVFKYSGVAGTDSFNMEHQVAEKNKELRLERLWNELPFLRYFLELENNKLWIIDKKKALKIRAAVNIYSTPID